MNQSDKLAESEDQGNGKSGLGHMNLVIQLAKGETFTWYARVMA